MSEIYLFTPSWNKQFMLSCSLRKTFKCSSEVTWNDVILFVNNIYINVEKHSVMKMGLLVKYTPFFIYNFLMYILNRETLKILFSGDNSIKFEFP